jgi:hypothetical protein
MNRWYGFLVELVVLTVMLAACGGLPIGDTPEEALREVLRREPDAPRGSTPQVQIHRTLSMPDHVVLLFTVQHRDAEGGLTLPQSGHALVERQADGWFPTSVGFGELPPPSEMAPVVSTDIQVQLNSGAVLMAYGWTKPSVDVATVEVVLDTGQTLTDTITNGMFVVIAPDATATITCELRAFDAQHNLIHQHRLDPDSPGAPPDLQQRVERCRR